MSVKALGPWGRWVAFMIDDASGAVMAPDGESCFTLGTIQPGSSLRMAGRFQAHLDAAPALDGAATSSVPSRGLCHGDEHIATPFTGNASGRDRVKLRM